MELKWKMLKPVIVGTWIQREIYNIYSFEDGKVFNATQKSFNAFPQLLDITTDVIIADSLVLTPFFDRQIQKSVTFEEGCV